MLVNLATQFGGDLENGAVVLHHEGHKFGGEQLVQIYLVGRAENTGWEHLDHLCRGHTEKKHLEVITAHKCNQHGYEMNEAVIN